MLTNQRKTFQPIIAIIAAPFLSWNPSILTMFSVLAALLFFMGIVERVYWLSIVSIFGFLFDALDGYIARKTGKTSLFGAFLDSTIDRVSDFLLITSFGFAGLVNWSLVVLVLFTSLFISYLRARAEAVFGKNKLLETGLMQRTERIVLLLIGFLLFLLFPSAKLSHYSLLTLLYLLICCLNALTIAQRFWAYTKLGR